MHNHLLVRSLIQQILLEIRNAIFIGRNRYNSSVTCSVRPTHVERVLEYMDFRKSTSVAKILKRTRNIVLTLSIGRNVIYLLCFRFGYFLFLHLHILVYGSRKYSKIKHLLTKILS